MTSPVAVSGLLPRQSVFDMTVIPFSVIDVNISIGPDVDSVNTFHLRSPVMIGSPGKRPKKKPAGHYHHGDLRRALVEEAVRTIQRQGVAALTLRSIGDRLGVSRTALYRHFADKPALLAAVGREGFRLLRLSLTEAWESHHRGRAGFEAMGLAYVRFAVAHPAHYRVMFGGFIESCEKDDEFVKEATAAFQVLVDSLVEQQQAGLVRRDDPLLLARMIWSLVHGIAMLAIDGQLRGADEQGEALNRYAIERIQDAIR
jgi:AcrR family transcriptional regulator